jgi:hypothetical protein
VFVVDDVEFAKLAEFLAFHDPSSELFLAVDVDVDVVVEVAEDARVDDGCDEEGDCRGGVVVDLDVEGL